MKDCKNAKTAWTEGVLKKSYKPYRGETQTDVVIVGGGITGVLCAYTLSKQGKNVILLEKGNIGSGTTSYTTAFLTQSLDTNSLDLIKTFGKKKATDIVVSHGKAIELIENIIKEEKIDCEFSRCSNYIYANFAKDIKSLESEYDACKKLGLDTTLVKNGSTLGFSNEGYIEIKNQAKFHPLKFVHSITEKAVSYGALICEQSEVVKIQKQSNGQEKVTTANGSIIADYVIVATYNPFDNPLSLYFKKGPYLSYVIELMVKDMNLEEGTYEDIENPYHYMRVDKMANEYRVILGGEDHRKEFPINKTKNFNALIEYADSIIPKLNRTIVKKWVGTILEPIAPLAFIGRITERNVLYNVAFSGNGMTYAGITAMICMDIINDTKNPWVELYNPRRNLQLKSIIMKGKDYAEEFFHGALKNIFTQNKKPKS